MEITKMIKILNFQMPIPLNLVQFSPIGPKIQNDVKAMKFSKKAKYGMETMKMIKFLNFQMPLT